MPKRVVDGDALWHSAKLSQVEPPAFRTNTSDPPAFPNKNPEPEDGQISFDHSVGLFPLDKRAYSAYAQTTYTQTIEEIRDGKLSNAEAVAKMDGAISAYIAKRGEFCTTFENFLRDRVWQGYLTAVSNDTPSLAAQDAEDKRRREAVSGMTDEEYGKRRQELLRRRRGE